MTPEQWANRQAEIEELRRKHTRMLLKNEGRSIPTSPISIITAINCIKDVLSRLDLPHGNYEEALMYVAEEAYQEMLTKRRRAKGE